MYFMPEKGAQLEDVARKTVARLQTRAGEIEEKSEQQALSKVVIENISIGILYPVGTLFSGSKVGRVPKVHNVEVSTSFESVLNVSIGDSFILVNLEVSADGNGFFFFFNYFVLSFCSLTCFCFVFDVLESHNHNN